MNLSSIKILMKRARKEIPTSKESRTQMETSNDINISLL